jgi:hypothetical protein
LIPLKTLPAGRTTTESSTGGGSSLAWTLAGGEVLFVEAVLLPQGKDLALTFVGCDSVEQTLQNALVPDAADANGNGHGKAALAGVGGLCPSVDI